MTQTYLESLLANDERILLITRNHGFFLFQKLLPDIFFIFLITGVSVYLTGQFGWMSLLGILATLLPLFDMERHLLDWRSREFIITNRRVIQISGIINKNVTDSSLEKVNDVKLSQSLWGRLLGFGDIEILTASELGANVFQTIGDPITFKKTMMDAKNLLDGSSDDTLHFTNVVKAPTIPDLIVELDELRIRGIITQEEFQAKKKELLSRM
ncbi:membrane protein [Leptolinea sp. HRD-7]|nr:membrane protein [Leptolinea sp. HRD-7]